MGSPRKGNTFRACEEFREHLQQLCPVEFEYIWLTDSHIEPCKGCFVCFPLGEEKCPYRFDDIQIIEQKMLDADGVIFTSPVYSMNVSGLMKIFIDRISYIGHRPRFFNQKSFILVTTGVFGARDVIKYLTNITWAWGFEVAGTAGLVTPNSTIPRIRAERNTKVLKNAAKVFARALLRNKRKNPGLMDVIFFHWIRGVIFQMETESPADYQYWKGKGWLLPGAQYYVDVQVNPLYLGIGKIVEWITERNVRKDLQSTSDST